MTHPITRLELELTPRGWFSFIYCLRDEETALYETALSGYARCLAVVMRAFPFAERLIVDGRGLAVVVPLDQAAVAELTRKAEKCRHELNTLIEPFAKKAG